MRTSRDQGAGPGSLAPAPARSLPAPAVYREVKGQVPLKHHLCFVLQVVVDVGGAQILVPDLDLDLWSPL